MGGVRRSALSPNLLRNPEHGIKAAGRRAIGRSLMRHWFEHQWTTPVRGLAICQYMRIAQARNVS